MFPALLVTEAKLCTFLFSFLTAVSVLQPFLQLQCFDQVNAFGASDIVVHNGWHNSVYPHSVIDGSVCIESKDFCQTNLQNLCKIKNLTM